jgi:phenylalanyl-tRNA synthetase alpha chain
MCEGTVSNTTQLSVALLEQLKVTALMELSAVSDRPSLEVWRVAYLSRRSGRLTQELRSLSTLAADARRAVGAAANAVKTEMEAAYEATRLQLTQGVETGDTQTFDFSLPGSSIPVGRFHPTTQILNEVCDAFGAMGFQVVEGPEVEWERFNFEMLNIPKDHPARDMWNTLWVDVPVSEQEGAMLLRTHTSPMQARVMLASEPPLRVIIPGRCYRYEATDATHEWHFFQVEGLAVDEGLTFAELKGTLFEFARRVFGPTRQVRFRCDYFPFVEPGVDMSIDCFQCNGDGCRVCGKTGWIEIMGAGMVHPEVLRMAGYDPRKYSGFAFGIGAERIAMLKYGIDDIRHFYSNDVRFLRQF